MYGVILGGVAIGSGLVAVGLGYDIYCEDLPKKHYDSFLEERSLNPNPSGLSKFHTLTLEDKRKQLAGEEEAVVKLKEWEPFPLFFRAKKYKNELLGKLKGEYTKKFRIYRLQVRLEKKIRKLETAEV
jgi:hypothetical protein